MKQTKSFEIDMCNGTLMDKLISFSIPLMLSGILQLMFNAVDIIVVGRFAPEANHWRQSVLQPPSSMYLPTFLSAFP